MNLIEHYFYYFSLFYFSNSYNLRCRHFTQVHDLAGLLLSLSMHVYDSPGRLLPFSLLNARYERKLITLAKVKHDAEILSNKMEVKVLYKQTTLG